MAHKKCLLLSALSSLVFIASVASADEVVMSPIMSKFQVELYGHIKVDNQYADHGVGAAGTPSEWAFYTNGAAGARAYRYTARSTLLGINIKDKEGIVSAKTEIDFWGVTAGEIAGVSGTPSATTGPRLRLAYVTILQDKWELQAGQNWHLTTLELPETANDGYFANSGTLWYREPQVRGTYKPWDGTKFQFSVNRPQIQQSDSIGTYSAMPQFEAEAETKLGGVRLSLAGALSKLRNTTTGQYGTVNLIIAGFNIPYHNDLLNLKGTAWTGLNLGDFLGNLGNVGYDGQEVRTSGGFVDLKLKPDHNYWFNAIYGIDKADLAHVTTVNSVVCNQKLV